MKPKKSDGFKMKSKKSENISFQNRNLGSVLKINEKIVGVVIGIVLTVGVLTMIQITSAHTIGDNSSGFGGMQGMNSMHANSMMGQNHMNMDAADMAACMSGDVSQMDKNKDGRCDFCGMPVKACQQMDANKNERTEGASGSLASGGSGMMNSNMHNGMMSGNHTAMHQSMHGSGSCPMMENYND